MANEPLERISQLEHQMRRWRLVSLSLGLLLVCCLAFGVIFTAVPATREPGGFWTWLPWFAARERAAREDVLRAKLEEEAVQAMEAQKRAVEAKRAEDAAKKEP